MSDHAEELRELDALVALVKRAERERDGAVELWRMAEARVEQLEAALRRAERERDHWRQSDCAERQARLVAEARVKELEGTEETEDEPYDGFQTRDYVQHPEAVAPSEGEQGNA